MSSISEPERFPGVGVVIKETFLCVPVENNYNNIHTDCSLKNTGEKCGGKILNVFHLKRIILTQEN